MAKGKFSVEAVFKATDRMTAPVRNMQSRTQRAFRSINRAMAVTKAAGRELGGVFRKLRTPMLIASGAAALAGRAIFKAGSDFEQAITDVGAVGLQTRDQIADLEAKAKEIGRTTKFTATEAAQGMELMARAGFTNEQILSGITGVMAAAAAEGADLAATTETIAATLKGMGLEASETGRVADVLALASARTKSSIGSLGESMKNLAPIARTFGIELEDAVGMVALLQDVGLDASEAGTATATMLTKLSKPTAAVERQMREMGVSFRDAAGNMLAPTEIFANMSKAAREAGGNMDQVAFFAELVGLRGQKAALNLKDMFESGAAEKLVAELQNAEGAASKMAGLRMDTLKGDLTLLGSAIDGLKVGLFNLESGPLRGVVQRMTEWVGMNQERIIEGVGKALDLFTELGGVFSDAFLETIRGVADGFSAVFGEDDASRGREWVEVLTEAARSMGQLAAIAVTAAGVFTAAVVGIGILVTKVFSGLKAAAQGVIDFIGERVFGIVDWFSDLGAIFDAEGMGLGEKAIEIGKHIVEGLVKGIQSLARAPVDALLKIGGGALDAAKSVLGIRSPSREMERLGEMTALGFERGMTAGIPDITAIVQGMSGSLLREAGAIADMAALRSFATPGLGNQEPPQPPQPQVVNTTASRIERNIEERVERTESELVIRDQTGRAELREPKRGGAKLRLEPSGAL